MAIKGADYAWATVSPAALKAAGCEFVVRYLSHDTSKVPPRTRTPLGETPICAESTCEAAWVNGEWWMPPGADKPDPHRHRPSRFALEDPDKSAGQTGTDRAPPAGD